MGSPLRNCTASTVFDPGSVAARRIFATGRPQVSDIPKVFTIDENRTMRLLVLMWLLGQAPL
jgi:hypothetical protein